MPWMELSPPAVLGLIRLRGCTDGRFDILYELFGHWIRLCSVDYGCEWLSVDDKVLELVEWG